LFFLFLKFTQENIDAATGYLKTRQKELFQPYTLSDGEFLEVSSLSISILIEPF